MVAALKTDFVFYELASVFYGLLNMKDTKTHTGKDVVLSFLT